MLNTNGLLKRSPIGSIEIERKIQKLYNELRYIDMMRQIFNQEIVTAEELLSKRVEHGQLVREYPIEAEANPKARPIAEQLRTFGVLTQHDYPVLDLRPVHDLGGVKRWLEMVDDDGDVIMSPVYAGAVIELIYVGGLLHKAITKGCGLDGMDITAQAYLVEGIPQEIDNLQRVSIRGTVTIPTVECQTDITRAVTRALLAFRTTDPELTRLQQHLRFVPDELYIPEVPLNTSELRFILFDWDFYIDRAATMNAKRRETGLLDEMITAFYQRFETSEFLVTGLRLTVDSALRKMELGYTSRYAEWAINLVKVTSNDG